MFFSGLSIFFVHKVAQLIALNKKFTLVATSLFSFSALQINQAWQLRMYSLVILFMLLSIYFLLSYLKHDKNKYLVFFITASLLGSLTDYSFLWYLLPLNLALLTGYFTDKQLKENTNLYLSTGLLDFLTLIYLLIFAGSERTQIINLINWIPHPNLKSVLVAITSLYGFNFFEDFYKFNVLKTIGETGFFTKDISSIITGLILVLATIYLTFYLYYWLKATNRTKTQKFFF